MLPDIDPSLVRPFLAAKGKPIPAIDVPAAEPGTPEPAPTDPLAVARDMTDPGPIWPRGRPDLQEDSPFDPSVPRPPSTDFPRDPGPSRAWTSQFDSADLARTLSPFTAEALPPDRSASGIDRVMSASSPPVTGSAGPADPVDLAAQAGFGPTPAQPARAAVGFDLNTADPLADFLRSTPGSDGDSSTASGGGPGIEARLTRAVDRLERIAELFEQSDSMVRGGAPRPFRGRVDG